MNGVDDTIGEEINQVINLKLGLNDLFILIAHYLFS